MGGNGNVEVGRTRQLLSRYDKRGYHPGASIVRRTLWYVVGRLFFDSYLCPVSAIKVALLRIFGAKIGYGVIIKPKVRIKYPWHLTLGDDVWIGEDVWIDNLCSVRIDNDVCLSQGVYLMTGNHDYKDPRFGLIVKNIVIESGAWLGARSIVCPGLTVGSHAVVTVGSVLQSDAKAGVIYRGNPALSVRTRRMKARRYNSLNLITKDTQG